jgi:uncharacterized membrane protein
MKRYLSIDILRAVAILLMVQVHFVDHLSTKTAAPAWLYNASCWLGEWPAPLFSLLLGLSFSLWTRKEESLGRSDGEITRIAIRRGIFLFVLGIVFNFLVWLPEGTFNWDILTLLGVSMAVLAFARKLPPVVLVTLCLVVLLISPPLRTVGDYSVYWVQGYYAYDFTFRDVVSGFFVNGYFPLLPWVIFPLAGHIIGEVAFRRRESSTQTDWRLAAAGIGFMALAVVDVALGAQSPFLMAKHYATGFTLYPASTEYILGMLGFSLLCLAILRRWVDRNERITGAGPVLTFFRRYSYLALTVYIVHLAVHLWPLWLYGVWMGQEDPTYYWRQATSTPVALGLAVAFIVLFYFVLIRLERQKKLSVEWWMRWLCEWRWIGPEQITPRRSSHDDGTKTQG